MVVTASFENFWALLARSRLLSAEGLREARLRWLRTAGAGSADLLALSRWLVASRLLTDYQAGALLRGHADRLFLNDYKLLDRLGSGRMAGVFKAVHRTGEVVAIKVLPPSKTHDPEAFARFQREARIALKLKHPNIVRTFQVAEDNGLHFLVMEYLEGETLEEVLKRRGKLKPAEAVFLIHQAILGLHYLHEQAIVHRDLKPSNLMLLPGDDAPRCQDLLLAEVKVLDVGLGRALFDDLAADPIDLTAPGAILGDVNYMAPEQADDAHAADVRSDIYSLGCVLYHALAGQPPFPDANPVRTMIRHAQETPRPVRAFNPAVSDGLQPILSRMLQKDPALRYCTPDHLARDLEKLLVGQAHPTPRPLGPRASAFQQWLDSQEDVSLSASSTIPTLPAIKPAMLTTEDTDLGPAPGSWLPAGQDANRLGRIFLLGLAGIALAITVGFVLARLLH